MDPVVFTVTLFVLLAASWQDIRTREVADTLTYGLLVFGIAYGAAKAALESSWIPLWQMLLGLGIMLVLGLFLYRTGQWGGADTKLLMGLGALLGLGFGSLDLVFFLILALFAGAGYGILSMLVLMFKNWKKFRPAFVTLLRKPGVHRLRYVVLGTCFLLVILVLVLKGPKRVLLVFLLFLIYGLFYLWLAVKAVEQGILIRWYKVEELTEGDWIQKDVVVKGKRVCGPKDLGISPQQIAKLKRLKVRKVLVKEGIPFVPSFLLGLVLLWLFAPMLYAWLP